MRGFIYLKSITIYAVAILALILTRFTIFATVAYAQETSPFSPSLALTCLNAESVRKMLEALQMIVLVAIILIVTAVLIFNAIGFVSTIAVRIGEFFMERLRFVFELLIVFILFLWPLTPSKIITGEANACASVDWTTLFSSGPLFFRIVGWIIRGLGIA